MSQVDGREPVRSASALGVRSQPLALLLLLCSGLLNVGGPQVSSQDELGERAQRTAAVRPAATSFIIMHAFLVQSLSDRVCVPQTVRRGPPQGSSGRVFTGRAGLRPQSAGAVVPRSGDGSPPSAKLTRGILMRLMWLCVAAGALMPAGAEAVRGPVGGAVSSGQHRPRSADGPNTQQRPLMLR